MSEVPLYLAHKKVSPLRKLQYAFLEPWGRLLMSEVPLCPIFGPLPYQSAMNPLIPHGRSGIWGLRFGVWCLEFGVWG